MDTAHARIVLSNVGARLMRWQLKGYTGAKGEMVDLVPSELPPDQPSPFTLTVPDAALTKRMRSAIYRVSGDTSGHVDAETQPREVVFEYEEAGGLVVKKTMQFEPQRHVVRLTAQVRSGQSQLNPTVVWGPGLGDIGATSGGGSFFTGNYVQAPQAIYQRDSKVERHATDALNTQPVHEGNFRFVGIDDHYFIATAVGGGPGARGVQAADVAGCRRDQACAGVYRHHAVADAADPDVLRRAEAVRRTARRGRRAGAGHQLRDVRVAGRAAAEHAEVAVRVRGQLRLVDHRAHGHPEPGDVPAPAQELGGDEEDAGGAAADAGDPEALLALENDRPGEAEDERGDCRVCTRSTASTRPAAACRRC